MYLLIVHYTKPLEEVTPHAPAHGEWVKQYINAGKFIFAGPKKNKLGGAILTKSIEKNKLMEIIAQDSYVKAEVADYQIIDFDCKITAEQFELLQSL